jgi:hypothetical protein
MFPVARRARRRLKRRAPSWRNNDLGEQPDSQSTGGDGIAALQIRRADGETRTPDPFITSEVLYQLSYVGAMLVKRA